MRVQVPQHQLVYDARENLANFKKMRDADYEQGIRATAADTTPLQFAPIDAAFQQATAPLTRGGKQLIGNDEMRTIREVEAAIDEWRSNPVPNTAFELDGLRRRLDAIYPKSPDHVHAQRVITVMRNKVNDIIAAQSPTYASTVAGYASDTAQLNELSKALGVGPNKTLDASIRKMLTISRDPSIKSKYSQNLLGQLEDAGPNLLKPAIAGQELSPWMPHGTLMRSTAGAVGSGAALAALAAPAALGALGFLPLASPRVIGEAAFKLGQGRRLLDKAGRLKPYLPKTNTVAQFANPQLED
jgi:hypothetical protein